VRKFLVILLSLCSFAQAAILPIASGPISKVEFFSKTKGQKFFPKVSGSNLEGKIVNIPEDLTGAKRLLIVAFKREQQKDVDTWLDATKKLLSKHNNFAVYELPTIKEMNLFLRFNINNGMRYGIPSQEQRERTITLYLDKEKFKDSLSIKSEEFIYAYLINQKHEIIWQAKGLASNKNTHELEKLLN
jgi:hypothetical protein